MNLADIREMVGPADAALVVVLVGVIGVVLLMQPPEDGDGDYEPSSFCQEVATQTEANYTSQVDDIECRCEPGSDYRDQLDTPGKVANVTDLHDALVCDVTYGEQTQQLVYPLLRINETKYEQYNGTINRSELNQTGVGNIPTG